VGACPHFPGFARVPGRRSAGSVAHPADMGGVRRAVVKIYHGRDGDR
jgi:hypothetical protein